MRRGLAACALLLSLTGRSAADTLADHERAVHAAVRLRDAATREREAKRTEAAALADEIAQAKAEGGRDVRAGERLSERLRAFDRLAAALDVLDRKVESASAAVAGAQREFAQAADAEADRLAGRPPHEQAAAALAVEEARDRVRAATEAPSFRPPLEVHRTAEDGPVEIEGKLALLEAERRRLAEDLARLDAEDLVLGERLAGKRRWAESLGLSRRDAAAPLLEREAQEVRRALARLAHEREELAVARARRRDGLRRVDAMVQEMTAR